MVDLLNPLSIHCLAGIDESTEHIGRTCSH